MATVITSNSITTTTFNGKVAPSRLFKEVILTGSPVQSITVDGLDINTHKSYYIEIELKNTSTTYSDVYFCINGDTTLTNYYSQYCVGVSSSALASRFNNSRFGAVSGAGNEKMASSTNLMLVDGTMHGIFSSSYRLGKSELEMQSWAVTKTSTVTNITSITVLSANAGTLGLGSKIRIYRGDL